MRDRVKSVDQAMTRISSAVSAFGGTGFTWAQRDGLVFVGFAYGKYTFQGSFDLRCNPEDFKVNAKGIPRRAAQFRMAYTRALAAKVNCLCDWFDTTSTMISENVAPVQDILRFMLPPIMRVSQSERLELPSPGDWT